MLKKKQTNKTPPALINPTNTIFRIDRKQQKSMSNVSVTVTTLSRNTDLRVPFSPFRQ